MESLWQCDSDKPSAACKVSKCVVKCTDLATNVSSTAAIANTTRITGYRQQLMHCPLGWTTVQTKSAMVALPVRRPPHHQQQSANYHHVHHLASRYRLDTTSTPPYLSSDHSRMHSIHHRVSLSHRRDGDQSHVSIDTAKTGSGHGTNFAALYTSPSTRKGSSSAFSAKHICNIRILLTCCLLTALYFAQPSFCIRGADANDAADASTSANRQQQHHSSYHYHSKHKSSILSSLLTFNELITAESIYPCLDTFDVVLMRSTDGQSSSAQSQQPTNNKHRDHVSPDHNQTRQLVRVYWATKEIVDRIMSATAQHLSTDRLYPKQYHPHHLHQHHQQGHHSKHYHRKAHHYHHHALRPSMLIEMRQLNYVREYVLPVKSQLVRMRCDIFEPKESIYYCFIYVILHRHAVFFESLPYCVPTTLTEAHSEMAGGGADSKINEINQRPAAFPGYPKLIGLPQQRSNDGPVVMDMGLFGRANDSTRKYLNDDHGQTATMAHEHEGVMSAMAMAKSVAIGRERDELDQIRAMILPPGPAAYGNSAGTRQLDNSLQDSDYIDPISESESGGGHWAISVPVDYTEKDANIRQFALKSADQSDYDAERRRSAATARRRKKVLIQTRSCYCAGQSVADSSGDAGASSRPMQLKQSLVRVNLTASETTVLHLIITSCPAAVDELADDDSREIGANYGDNSIANETTHPNSGTADDFSEVPSTGTTNQSDSAVDGGIDSSKADKKSLAKQKGDKKQKKQRKKGNKKLKATRLKEKELSAESSTESGLSSTSSTTSPSTSTTELSTIGLTSISSSPTTSPTVCILSIDNPSEYSFRMDSIEPSMDWPVVSESANFGGIDFSSTIDLIDYLHKFPFLVVRNGQLSIDPQMNIENRSQTHYLRSGHLRFEALSSINVTLRFRRSASAAARDHQQRLVEKSIGEVDDAHWSGVLATVRSIVDSTVSYIAYKVVNYDPSEESSLTRLTAFHITSMLLSFFIMVTIIIYAVIALHAHRANPTRTRVVQIQTPIEMNDFNSADSSLMAPSGSNRTDELADCRSVPQSPSGHNHNTKRHDSLGSFSLEQQSLEMDYYDYAVPLMVHSSSRGSFGDKQQSSTGGGGANSTVPNNKPAATESSCNHSATAVDLSPGQPSHHHHSGTICSSSSYRRSLETAASENTNPPAFRTLPIKVNSPNRKICSTANASMCSLVVTGNGSGGGQTATAIASSSARPNHGLINETQCSVPLQHQQQPNSNVNIATLTRLSFTKPPVLLSTFGRNE